MKDRAMQACIYLPCNPVSETKADQNSYGFRPERSTQDAIEQCFILLSMKTSAQWILEGDIKGCFDNISHEWLIDNIPMDKEILHKWLKAGYIYERILYPTEAGTPQGGIISPTLANMTLDGLEAELRKFRSKTRFIWLDMRMTLLLPEARKSCWKMKSNPWWKVSSAKGLELSAGENQHHAYRERI